MKELLRKPWLHYVLGIIICCAYIMIGHAMFGGKIGEYVTMFDTSRTKATVTETAQEETTEGKIQTIKVDFFCRITNGEHKGEVVQVMQQVKNTGMAAEKPVETGDKIFLQSSGEGKRISWTFASYNRNGVLLALGLVFVIMLFVLGGLQGVRTILSLLFTGLAVFYVFLPSLVDGQNVYLQTLITAGFIIVMTLFMVYGFNKKSIVSGMACMVGIFISLLLVCIVQHIMHLSGNGILSDESVVYMMSDLDVKFDLQGIIFSVVIIGAIGAIMDIAVSMVTSLEEIMATSKRLSQKKVWKAGLKIGRDMMGTMSNTLILAYIGSAELSVFVLISSFRSVERILNTESIIIEIMSALIGSMGLICTIPVASYLCAKVYFKKDKVKTNKERNVLRTVNVDLKEVEETKEVEMQQAVQQEKEVSQEKEGTLMDIE